MKKTFLLTLILALGLTMEVVNADFMFGDPINLGPSVNSVSADQSPSISADGLSLYFSDHANTSSRSGGYGKADIWVATRQTIDDSWGMPENLGSIVNSSSVDESPCISADGLSLYFTSNRPSGSGNYDLWVTTRTTKDNPWEEPVNLGPTVNSSYGEFCPSISADGLSLYFCDFIPFRPGGQGILDIYVTTRLSASEPWGTPENLGSIVNSSGIDATPHISADGLLLFLSSDRPGASGDDLYVARRSTTEDPWGKPVNLGSTVNSNGIDFWPNLSADGSTLYFSSTRSGGSGNPDLWQVSITPVVDLNSDGIVDAADMCMIVDNWGTDESLCDIGPMPWGDGIVDVQDLIVLAEHLFEEIPPVE